MKNLKIIGADGWFTAHWGSVFSIGGLLLAALPWFFSLHIGLCLILTLVGSAVSLLGSYEAKAKQFDFQAPFTNDPLGWRKAKESYKSDPAQTDDPSKDKNP